MRRALRLLPLVALSLLLAAPARSQVLSGTWFKLKISAKGWVIDVETGTAKAASYQQTAYMSLLPVGIGYTAQIYTEMSPGNWVGGPGIELGTTGVGELFVVNQHMTIDGAGGASLDLSTTLRLIFKFDDSGVLKKATIKTLAGELSGSSTLDGTNLFIGSVKLSGKTVEPTSLPF
jgi:hypothetical protein